MGQYQLRGGCGKHGRGRWQRKSSSGATKRGVVHEADARAGSCLTVRSLGHGSDDSVHDKHTVARGHEGDAVVLEARSVRPLRESVAGGFTIISRLSAVGCQLSHSGVPRLGIWYWFGTGAQVG